MSNEGLLSQYEHSSRLFQLADRLTMSQPQHMLLKNLQGSSPAFIIARPFLTFRSAASSTMWWFVKMQKLQLISIIHWKI